VKLNLGANDRRIEGFISVDIAPPCDQLADLSQRWPWEDSSIEAVEAHSVFEHLPDKRHTMNELWRVLQPGGRAVITVPDASEGDGAFCDPTHCSYWTSSDFEYYEVGNFARERFRESAYYAIKADFNVLIVERHKFERKWGGYVVELWIVLEAVK
jgi:SAM-dependent methyltransferase